MAATLLLGLLLAGITGYFIWHPGQDKYIRVEMAGASEGVGIAGAEEPVPEETGGTSGVTNPDSVQGTDGPDAVDGGPSDAPNDVKGQDLETGTEDKDPSLQPVPAGNVLPSGHVLNAYQKAGNIRGVVDSGFRQVTDANDIFMTNEEFPFSRRGTAAADKQFTFWLPPEKVSMFQGLGIDIVTLANNHTLDFGTDALLGICSTLDDAGVLRVGVGANLEEARKPVFMKTKGRKIGFPGTSRVIPESSQDTASKELGMLTTHDLPLPLEEIRKTREACDYLVTYVYWGIERDERLQEYQRILRQRYIDAGADLAVGSHPHVMQGLEYYKGKPIVHSPGNFVFGSSTPRTALLKVEWNGEDALLRLAPGTPSGGYTRVLTDEGEKVGFYQYITSISYGVTVGKDGIVVPGEENTAEQEESGI